MSLRMKKAPHDNIDLQYIQGLIMKAYPRWGRGKMTIDVIVGELCRFCHAFEDEHANGQCLFSSSKYQAIGREFATLLMRAYSDLYANKHRIPIGRRKKTL